MGKSALIVLLITLLISCRGEERTFRIKGKPRDNLSETNSILINYKTPASSYGSNNRPTFTITGVNAGDLIRLYQNDPTCSSAVVSSGAVGVGKTSIELALVNPLSVEDTYTFYADSTDLNGHQSSCSTGISYELTASICPVNFVHIEANTTLATSEFCIAKYEAKCSDSTDGQLCSGSVISESSRTPWVNISASNAWLACDDLNSESDLTNRQLDINNDGTYALISNREWMAVAREIEAIPSNWSNGVIGDSSLSRGQSNGTLALAAGDDTDACIGTGQTCSDSIWHINKRVHNLNNGVIWDFAGNVYEWVDWSSADSIMTTLPVTTHCTGASWAELLGIGCQGLTDVNDYLPSNTAYNSSHGIGQYYRGNGAFLSRGGSWSANFYVGVYTLALTNSNARNNYGFRCVFRP